MKFVVSKTPREIETIEANSMSEAVTKVLTHLLQKGYVITQIMCDNDPGKYSVINTSNMGRYTITELPNKDIKVEFGRDLFNYDSINPIMYTSKADVDSFLVMSGLESLINNDDDLY